tara:strand:- start:13979 stop:16291 length:2313 start_codon:yes stop_codon:yes gene_type:complete
MIYKKDDKKFFNDLIDKVSHHQKNNIFYRDFLRKKKYSPPKDINEVNKIPYIHVSSFKKDHKKLVSIKENNIKQSISSSSTSGLPSIIYLDRDSLKKQMKMSFEIMSDYIGDYKRPMVIYDIPPTPENKNQMGARMSANVSYMRFSNKTFFALRIKDGIISIDNDGLSRFINENNDILHFGFTYMLYNHVIESDLNLKKTDNGKLIHIGGWKKLEDKQISKKEFNKRCQSVFGKIDVIDIYGFTELMGMNFPDCEYGNKHVPNNTRVITRSLDDLEINTGEPGQLQFISTFTDAYSGNSILTDDIGIVNNKTKCKCGRETHFFTVIGRKPRSETRGCGDILGLNTEKSFKGKKIYIYGSDSDDFTKKILELNKIEMPIEPLLLILDSLSKSWLNNTKLTPLKQQGLSFLSRWCSKENLEKIINDSLFENLKTLDNFQISKKNTGTLIYSKPKGIVSHWVAGNVPLLGMLVLIQSIVTKNINIVKVSQDEDGSLYELISGLNKISIKYGDKFFHGSEILKSILVLRFGRSNIKASQIMSEIADVKVAWGSGESIENIKKYKSKPNCTELFFGPKTSFSIVSEKYINNRISRDSFFLKMARDISSFDQRACSSPHTIFYKGNNLDNFISDLGSSMDKTLKLIPKINHKNDFAVNEAIMSGEFTGNVFFSKNKEWAIINNNDIKLELPSFSRVIYVKKVKNLNLVKNLIHPEVQSVSLGLDKKEKISIAKKLSEKGVLRFPDIGLMTNFDNPWDGKIILPSLIDNISLGGPIY